MQTIIVCLFKTDLLSLIPKLGGLDPLSDPPWCWRWCGGGVDEGKNGIPFIFIVINFSYRFFSLVGMAYKTQEHNSWWWPPAA